MKNIYYIKVNGIYGFYYSRSTDEKFSLSKNWSSDVYYIDKFETIEEAKETAEYFYSDQSFRIDNIFETESWTPYEDNLLAENQI